MFELAFPSLGRSVPAYEANDKDSTEALAIAKELHAKGLTVSHVGVDRFEGLVLVGSQEAWRFQHAICSFGGEGPQTTAEILELFGFGTKANIMKVISNRTKSRFYFPQ